MIKQIKFWINRCSCIFDFRSLMIFFGHLITGKSAVRLEASSMCQLNCPVCPTGRGITKKKVIGWGYLKFKDFKKFVDENSRVKYIELSNWGEIFLNPELEKIIKYAYNKHIILTARNGVNLNNVSEKIIKCLVKYKFKCISVSIDGATNNTYKIYRRGGNLSKVINNIKRINYYKQKYNSKLPKLYWQFVIFGHNEHELPLAREMAKNLGMRFFPKLKWIPDSPLSSFGKNKEFSPVKDKQFVSEESRLGLATRTEFEKKTKLMYQPKCNQLWLLPTINWDGKLLGCCINMYGDFGNIFESGLNNCLNSEKYIYAKKMILRKKKMRKDIPCSHCFVLKPKR